jgi:hypothetical protein
MERHRGEVGGPRSGDNCCTVQARLNWPDYRGSPSWSGSLTCSTITEVKQTWARLFGWLPRNNTDVPSRK